jgi:hypothetical protein
MSLNISPSMGLHCGACIHSAPTAACYFLSFGLQKQLPPHSPSVQMLGPHHPPQPQLRTTQVTVLTSLLFSMPGVVTIHDNRVLSTSPWIQF